MKELMHIIRDELSGMFTKNIVDKVVQRIEKAIERERGSCGTCKFYAEGMCGTIHGKTGKICEKDYCNHYSRRE